MTYYKHDGLSHTITISRVDADGKTYVAIPQMYREPYGPEETEAPQNSVTLGLAGVGFFVVAPGQILALDDSIPTSTVTSSCPGLVVTTPPDVPALKAGVIPAQTKAAS